MENHRLTTMVEDYPVDLFNQIYEDTRNLRKSLTYSINPRYYGVDKSLIESWFDDKFIYVFNKHCKEHNPDVLKGFIINSLQTFRNRVLKQAYCQKNQLYSEAISIDTEYDLVNFMVDKEEISNRDLFMGIVNEFFKRELSEDAFLIYQLQLNPPPYILNRIKKFNSSINAKLILEFLGMDNNSKNMKLLRSLRKEISLTTEKAKAELPALAFSH